MSAIAENVMAEHVRHIREAQRRRATLAARAATEPPRQGLLAILAAIDASDDAVMGLDDHDHDAGLAEVHELLLPARDRTVR